MARTQETIQHLLNDKDYHEVIKLLSDNDDLSLVKYRILAHYELHEYTESYKLCEYLYNNNIKDEDLFYMLIDCMITLKESEDLILIKFDEALFYYPDSTSINNILGKYCIGKADYLKAIEYFTFAKNKSENFSFEDGQIGYCYYRLKEFEKSLDFFKSAHLNDPHDCFASHYIAILYFRDKKYTEAIKWFKLEVELNDVQEDTDFYMGMAYKKIRKIKNAVKHFELAFKHKPNDLIINLELANYNYDMNNYKFALRHYLQVIKQSVDDTWVMIRLAYCYNELGQYEESYKYAKRAYEMNIENPDAVEVLAHTLYYSDMYEDALILFIAHENLADKVSHMSYVLRGDCYRKLDDLENAHNNYDKAKMVDPDNLAVYISLARLYLEEGKYDIALELLLDKCDSNNSRVIKTLGDIYSELNEYDRAIDYYHESIVRFADVEALEDCSILFMETKRYDEAMRGFNILINLDEYNSRYIYGLGKCYFRQKMYFEALEHYEASKSLGLNEPSFISELGVCYERTKRFDEALELYNSIYNNSNKSFLNYHIALCYFEKQEFRKAISFFELEKTNFQYRGRVLAHIINCQRQLNNKEDANTTLEEFATFIELIDDESIINLYNECKNNLSNTAEL